MNLQLAKPVGCVEGREVGGLVGQDLRPATHRAPRGTGHMEVVGASGVFRDRSEDCADAGHTLRASTLRRSGVTLVELLVVIILLTTLATLVLAIAPAFSYSSNTKKVKNGAEELRQWFLIARQRAITDRAPRGIQLVPPEGSDPANMTIKFRYIEQPEDLTGTLVYPIQVANTGQLAQDWDAAQAKVSGVTYKYGPRRDTAGNVVLPAVVDFDILPGDVLSLPDVGIKRRIMAPLRESDRGGDPNQATQATTLQLDGPVDVVRPDGKPKSKAALVSAAKFRIYRQARAIAGETLLELPKDVAVDLTLDPSSGLSPRSYPPDINSPNGYLPYEILFSPSGQVIGPSARTGRISFWVRDISLSNPNTAFNVMPPGENILVTIYTRTGQIAIHPVNDSNLPASAFNFSKSER